MLSNLYFSTEEMLINLNDSAISPTVVRQRSYSASDLSRAVDSNVPSQTRTFAQGNHPPMYNNIPNGKLR